MDPIINNLGHDSADDEPLKVLSVGLQVSNQLVEPYFDFHTSLPYVPDKNLLYYLETAANGDSRFMFTAKYYTSQKGFFVEAINDLFGDVEKGTYWEIVDIGTGKPLDLGVSYYIPGQGQGIKFQFTTESERPCDGN